MMNLEDFVDMEWVDDSANVAATEQSSSSEMMLPDFFLLPQQQQQQQPLTPPTMNMTGVEQQNPDFMKLDTLPSTEQIKQLIEIAKQQLALREQLQQLQHQQQQQQLFQALSNTTASATTEEQTQTAAPSTIFAPPPPATAAAAANPGDSAHSTAATADANGALPPPLSPSSITSTDMVLPAPVITSLEDVDITVKTEMTPTPSLHQDSLMADGNESSSNNDNSNGSSCGNRQKGSLSHFPEEHLSLEAYAEADGIDLKKLTPKERRQLRNKISARNFRVRRKEYISTLEGQVNDHKMAAEALREKLKLVEDENKKLRLEMDSLRKQNQQLLQQQQQQQQQTQQTQQKQSSPSTTTTTTTTATTTTVSSPRISSPLPKPNLNKDISILGTKATDSYRQQEHCILVSNAVMPNWDYDSILHQKISTTTATAAAEREESPHISDTMKKIIGQFLLSFVQLASTMPTTATTAIGTNQKQQNNNDVFTDTTHHNNKPLMPEDRDFTSSTVVSKDKQTQHQQKRKSTYMEYLYDVLLQSSLLNSSNHEQKSFWWWDNTSNHHHQHPRAA